jgi:hypothetical protein
MATTPCYCQVCFPNTFITRQPIHSPQLAVVLYALFRQEVGTGALAFLHISQYDYQPYRVQLGSLLGFFGDFVVIQVDSCEPPDIYYLAILAHWVDLDKFIWDPFFYLQCGGLLLGERFMQLEWRGELSRRVEGRN